MIPEEVIEIRRNFCRGKCDVDPTDPCAACPNGHWGRYTVRGCEDSGRALRKSNTGLRPGDLFSVMIFKITGQPTSNCGICGARKQTMNVWGWWRCWRSRKTITGWLVEEARKRGHVIDENAVLGLLKAGFKEFRERNKPMLDSEKQSAI